MNLIEITMAMLVFSLAANTSLQLWSSGARWSQTNAEQQETLRRVDAHLLRSEHSLRLVALAVVAGVEAEDPDQSAARCAAAGQWMAEQLLSGAGALPVGVQRQVSAPSSGVDGLWLTYRIEPMGLERRRLFTAAAHGLCPPAAPISDPEVGT